MDVEPCWHCWGQAAHCGAWAALGAEDSLGVPHRLLSRYTRFPEKPCGQLLLPPRPPCRPSHPPPSLRCCLPQDSLNFPIVQQDWVADEELLLIEVRRAKGCERREAKGVGMTWHGMA